MLLEIDDWRSVGDLQYRFNKCFPNLHLQFFDVNIKGPELYPISGDYLLEHIRRKHNPGVLSIKSWFTCCEVEQMLAQQFGLKTRVVPLAETNGVPANWGNMTLRELNGRVDGKAVPQIPVSTEMADELAGW